MSGIEHQLYCINRDRSAGYPAWSEEQCYPIQFGRGSVQSQGVRGQEGAIRLEVTSDGLKPACGDPTPGIRFPVEVRPPGNDIRPPGGDATDRLQSAVVVIHRVVEDGKDMEATRPNS
jgi:hypothetical protein